ncbi:MAG: hypothetical protein R3B13_09510 [Polyangiaceae bacterium]
MRLGLLGPATDRLDVLERAARFLHEDARAERVVYLGLDGALDRVVEKWATSLVGADAGEGALFARAAERCAEGSPMDIDAFVAAEREREALRAFEALPGDGTRLMELLGGRVAVLIHDKANLDEDDIASATFLVFGKSPDPLVKPVGSRWFLAPGHLGDFGLMLLEERADGVHLALFDSVCREIRRERLVAAPSARISVSDT